MADPFVHLRVASGYSLRYGASHPSVLVERAAEYEMDSLALTDRDGLYGAIRFAKACLTAGIAPILGVDLAITGFLPHSRPTAHRPRTPVRGGAVRDHGLPRVVAMATSRAGWAALCRLVTATHLGGERGTPVVTPELLEPHLATGEIVVVLGADSEFGVEVAREQPARAADVLARWRRLVPPANLYVAVTDHRTPGSGVWSQLQAARMLSMADRHQVPVVLTNAVRMADPHLAPTLDVLDASRRLAPLGPRTSDRRNAEGHLKPGKLMAEVADDLCQMAGRRTGGASLLAETRRLAMRCRLDPKADIGLGEIHLPDLIMNGQTVPGDAMGVLRARCEAGVHERYGMVTRQIRQRLDDELDVVGALGFAAYFLTVADIVEMIKRLGIRCAARGSGAGSMINYVLGISGIEPLRYGLIMERFLSPLRRALPDIDLDVESARRTEIYDHILAAFGDQRVACVAMLDTYRVRHAVRDVGAALSLPPGEIDAIAKAFPHIRARDARSALRDLPELRAAGLAERRLDVLFSLVESLDGLPRHVALHPCGVLLSDTTLRDRSPVEASFDGYPMSQFDKDDVEDIGLLKLDVLGIRMQSSMAHAIDEIERTTGERIDIDALAPFDDPETYQMIARSETLGCFQIESPGQRELVGKFAPDEFNDIIIDISLFRPGPVKSDMIVPFLEARQGWRTPGYLHPDLEPVLAETGGVVVFHEQVIKIISVLTGCSLAEGDELRRALGDKEGQQQVRRWFVPTCEERGYAPAVIEQAWKVLEAFASFGFCKAHAAAFALPTYQSAWLKRHFPAPFLAGVLSHDPGMYPKRLILEEARRLGIPILGLDVNSSDELFRIERVGHGDRHDQQSDRREPDDWGIRLCLADVKGITDAEVQRIIAGRPYQSLADFWNRARVARPVAERLVLAGGFDSVHGIDIVAGGRRGRSRNHLTRRDLLLAVADLDRTDRVDRTRGRGLKAGQLPAGAHVQLPLDVGVGAELEPAGLSELSPAEQVRAELEILGLDASRHVIDFYAPFLDALGTVQASTLLGRRTDTEILVAGVKVATQTPPIRSGRRVVFLTVDDTTGPVDATFFEDAQGPYASTVFNSWLLLVRGVLRRTGPRGVSVRATGAWDLAELHELWRRTAETEGAEAALAAVHDRIAASATVETSEYRRRPDRADDPGDPQNHTRAGGMGQRRVLVHASGFRQSPYADVRPAGTPASQPPRKLWHASPGSSGR